MCKKLVSVQLYRKIEWTSKKLKVKQMNGKSSQQSLIFTWPKVKELFDFEIFKIMTYFNYIKSYTIIIL